MLFFTLTTQFPRSHNPQRSGRQQVDRKDKDKKRVVVDLRSRDGELLRSFDIVDFLNRTSKRQYDGP